MASAERLDPSPRQSIWKGIQGIWSSESLMKFGSRLHESPVAWRAAALGLRVLSQPRRAGQIRRYLESNHVRLLRLGAGRHRDEGWLSADLVPLTKDTVYLDATKRLPIPDESFNFIVCEHMIEHVSLREARSLLVECRRVLCRGGVLRLVTPNLDRFIDMMSETTPDEAAQFYISAMNTTIPEIPDIPAGDTKNPVYMLNRVMHDWGHRFLYNKGTLTTLLIDAGFTSVMECAPFMSTHPELVGVDRHHEEVGERTNEIESLLLEAQVD